MDELPRGELTAEEADRLRRRDSLPVLPAVYQEVAAIIGMERTLRLAREFGGDKVKFAARPQKGSRLLKLLGGKSIALLHRHFGAGRVALPTAWPYLNLLDARTLRARGWSHRAIAARLRISLSTAAAYTAGVPTPPPTGRPGARPPRPAAPAPVLPLFPEL